ncbi:MAG: glycosyltransferase family 9 protein, partial [Candidatus Aminicenantales bacterium]
MKIVIRAPNWIGDSVLAFPCLESLHHNFSQAEIWIAARKWVKDVFTGHNLVSGIIQLPEKVDINSLIAAAKKLQQNRFDFGLLLTNSFSSALLFYLARIPQRWGYYTDGRRFLLTKGIVVQNKPHPYHQVYYYLNLLEGLGLEILPPKLRFYLSAKEKQQAKDLLSQLNIDSHSPLIIFHPG